MSDFGDEPPGGGRIRKQVDRMGRIRRMEVGPRRMIAAAMIACIAALATLYVLIATLAGVEFSWLYLAIAVAAGAALGLVAGFRAASSGAFAGVLAGLWIFLELTFAVLGLILEALASALAGIFGAFS